MLYSFFLNQCVSNKTGRALQEEFSANIIRALDLGYPGDASDETIFQLAKEKGCILITKDKGDFWKHWTSFNYKSHPGVIVIKAKQLYMETHLVVDFVKNNPDSLHERAILLSPSHEPKIKAYQY